MHRANGERLLSECANASRLNIFPNDTVIIRLVGALVVEQTEEWHLTRRYMSNESLMKTLAPEETKKLLETTEVA